MRELESKDALLMYEWMHDENVVGKIQREKFIHKSLADCEKFIRDAQVDKENIHKAIVDENDQYLGTVSLKNVNMEKGWAEFAITIRASAMGTGAGRFAMDAIIKYGFEVMGLREIFWYVKSDNIRAIRFYEKGGYERISEAEAGKYGAEKVVGNLGQVYWYRVMMDK